MYINKNIVFDWALSATFTKDIDVNTNNFMAVIFLITFSMRLAVSILCDSFAFRIYLKMSLVHLGIRRSLVL